jgi:hypothetical protein
MNEEEPLPVKQKPRANATKQLPVEQYTNKDFQLEVLDALAEVQGQVESWSDEFERLKDARRSLRFDPKTLMAIGAIALSITGYVLEDARNSSKRDAEIETTKARVARLEQIATVNTEGRIRSEVQLDQLRAGQVEIKSMIEAHDSETTKILVGASQHGKARVDERGKGHDTR